MQTYSIPASGFQLLSSRTYQRKCNWMTGRIWWFCNRTYTSLTSTVPAFGWQSWNLNFVYQYYLYQYIKRVARNLSTTTLLPMTTEQLWSGWGTVIVVFIVHYLSHPDVILMVLGLKWHHSAYKLIFLTLMPPLLHENNESLNTVYFRTCQQFAFNL